MSGWTTGKSTFGVFCFKPTMGWEGSEKQPMGWTVGLDVFLGVKHVFFVLCCVFFKGQS